jgi:hypothetical protein
MEEAGIKQERRRGRKAQRAEPGVRVSLGLKVTPDIKNALDAAAKKNGRTQSQEAEARLERSFYAESWERVIADINARSEVDRLKRQVEGIRQQIARFENMDRPPGARAFERRLIEFRIATLDEADEAVRGELAELLAKAATAGDEPAE